jgi:hypothetical protein
MARLLRRTSHATSRLAWLYAALDDVDQARLRIMRAQTLVPWICRAALLPARTRISVAARTRCTRRRIFHAAALRHSWRIGGGSYRYVSPSLWQGDHGGIISAGAHTASASALAAPHITAINKTFAFHFAAFRDQHPRLRGKSVLSFLFFCAAAAAAGASSLFFAPHLVLLCAFSVVYKMPAYLPDSTASSCCE